MRLLDPVDGVFLQIGLAPEIAAYVVGVVSKKAVLALGGFGCLAGQYESDTPTPAWFGSILGAVASSAQIGTRSRPSRESGPGTLADMSNQQQSTSSKQD